jgi:hypothetical protein
VNAVNPGAVKSKGFEATGMKAISRNRFESASLSSWDGDGPTAVARGQEVDVDRTVV